MQPRIWPPSVAVRRARAAGRAQPAATPPLVGVHRTPARRGIHGRFGRAGVRFGNAVPFPAGTSGR
jgi:hypothetical protein